MLARLFLNKGNFQFACTSIRSRESQSRSKNTSNTQPPPKTPEISRPKPKRTPLLEATMRETTRQSPGAEHQRRHPSPSSLPTLPPPRKLRGLREEQGCRTRLENTVSERKVRGGAYCGDDVGGRGRPIRYDGAREERRSSRGSAGFIFLANGEENVQAGPGSTRTGVEREPLPLWSEDNYTE